MEVRPLEIRILQAHDLKNVNRMSKMDVYAVVSISGDQLNNPKLKTAVDKDGGTSPKWNFPMKFAVDEASVVENRLTLEIKLVSNRSLGNREIGVVHVQIKELFDSCVARCGGDDGDDGEEGEKSGSYGVRLPNGNTKGTLDLAYKFGEKYEVDLPLLPPPPCSERGVDAPPVTAYPSGFPGASYAYPPPPSPLPCSEKGVDAPSVTAYPSGFPGGASSAYPPPLPCSEKGVDAPPPVTAYPSGFPGSASSAYPQSSSNMYPPSDMYSPPPPGGYAYPAPPGAYPPPHGGMYPPPSGYGHPPPGYGYGGYPPPQQGYGYPPMQQPQAPKKGGGGGVGMGLGLGAGLLGGMLIGDMMTDF